MGEGSLADELPELISQLQDKKHLVRDRALNRLEALIAQSEQLPDTLFVVQLKRSVGELVALPAWEAKQGGLLAAQRLVPALDSGDAFLETLELLGVEHLEDEEARVRLAVGECFLALAKKLSTPVYLRVKDAVLSSIERNFEREAPPEDAEGQSDAASPRSSSPRRFTGSPRGSSPRREGAPEDVPENTRKYWTDLRHDTEGWKCLETSFKALQRLMEGCGPAFYSDGLCTPELRGLVRRALTHQNRFVRETGFFTLNSLAGASTGEALRSDGQEIARDLARGLGDNWSQVRYAASVATRTFMRTCAAFKEELYPVLVPCMCLNRYYVAEGVRIHAQDTWKEVMGTSGREAVAAVMPAVVEYYVAQSRADNHAVREAACYCMAELMCKIERECVSPFVPQLLGALIDCFKDASWPVRDAACTACGQCVTAFPEESRCISEELFELWFAHLVDNIPSVRADSALALGNAMAAYKEEAVTRVVEQLRVLLPLAKQQPSESQRYGDLENVTHFGVAHKKARDNDAHLHTDQTMYSCGSLSAAPAPGGRARAGSTTMLRRGGGCMDHGFARAKEPWEASEGALHLLTQLAAVEPGRAAEFMPTVADLASCTQFGHYHNLLDTLFKQLPIIAQSMGKRPFKQFLELFIPPLFFALNCGQRLAESSAGYCIGRLSSFIGPTIFEGRLTPAQRTAMRSSPFVCLGVPVGTPLRPLATNTQM